MLTILFFDGWKNKTLDFVEKVEKLSREYKMKEKYVLIEESLSTYLGHIW